MAQQREGERGCDVGGRKRESGGKRSSEQRVERERRAGENGGRS